MRPRELTLEGFRSFRTRTTLDFRDRHLIGIVGPIGAGKSSILDGVAFALFGKTPAFERDTRSLIHQLADVAQVQLIFEVDGQIWRITRGLRRKGQSGHKLERLAADEPGAPALEVVEREKPTRERVAELLGMDFDAFRRSVLLAQNRFADLLKASPGGRDAVLKGVFGYERFDAALQGAKRRVADAEAKLSSLAEEGTRLREARTALDDATAQAAEAATRAAAIEAARPTVDTLRRQLADAAELLAAATSRAATLERIAEMLPAPDPFEQTMETAERAGSISLAARAAADTAEQERRGAEEARDAIERESGDLKEFEALVVTMQTRGNELDGAAARLELARAEAVAAGDRVEASAARRDVATIARAGAEERAAAASEARGLADAALHDARHLEMAMSLRRELVEGEPCPVCSQVVATIPTGARSAGVRTAEKAAGTAQRAAERAASAREEARAEEAATAATFEAAAASLEGYVTAADAAEVATIEAEGALAAVKSELVDRLGAGDPRGLLEERERERSAAEAHLREATGAAADARAALDAAGAAEATAGERLAHHASVLSGAWGMLGAPRDITAEPGDLRMAFGSIGERLRDELDATRIDRDDANTTTAKVRVDLADVMAGLELDASVDFTDALAGSRARAATTQERVRGLETTIAEASDIERRVIDATADRDLATKLASDLQPSRFLAWALGEERHALAELGSVHLDDLTDGAYRFADDDSFRVADLHAGGAVRSADSLSGGETFLASLALALALAEMVTRGGGRLDAFFLDEGFGSLDPEHLERAMDGISHLVADDPRRVVVLVSHVEHMRQLLEDLVVLDKDPRTGDTVVVSGATLPHGPG